MYFYIIVLFPINKFYSFIIFSLLINTVILLLNRLVSILYIHFLSLRRYFLYLNIICKAGMGATKQPRLPAL